MRVLREYERGVIFRLGRLIATKGPGLILLIPLIDRMVKVELRTVTLSIPPQEVITRDNVPCRVNAVAYFRVVDQNRAVVEVENYLVATSQISQTALRSVLGKAELDQLLADRERLNEELQKIIDESTEPWGVKVTAVEIKDVEIPEQMQRAMARQAEAERERRAKIINSEGEFQAAQKLTDAADIISTNPASLQLRYLQTLLEIGSQPEHDGGLPAADGRDRAVPRPRRPQPWRQQSAEAERPAPGRAGPAPRAAGERPDEPDAGRPAPLPLLSAPPEIRIDQLSGLRTILAPGRAARPDNFTAPRGRDPKGPGGLPLLRGATRTRRRRSSSRCARRTGRAPDAPGWRTRVVPNLYPALGAPEGRTAPRRAARRPKRAPSPPAATRCWPRGGRANPTSSPPARRPAPTRC